MIFLSIKDRKKSMMPPPLAADDEYPLALRKDVSSFVLILLILFLLPIPRGTYKDGGTKDYCALTYRIIVWNRLTDDSGRDASEGELTTYHNTSVFWFPANFKSIDELYTSRSRFLHYIRNLAGL